jgi:hypothetical protein
MAIISKDIEFAENMIRREYRIGCLGVGITERSIQVVLPLGVLLCRRVIFSKFVLCTLSPSSDMPLNIMLVAIIWPICKQCC